MVLRNIALVLLLVIPAAACDPSSSPRSCTQHSDCAADSFCEAGSCHANRAPTAAIDLPAVLESFRTLTFDGSRSSDPDPEDSIVSYAWTIAPSGAPCQADRPQGTTPTLGTVFGCAGEFQITLVVTDSLGLQGSASVGVRVAPTLDPPAVIVGQDLALDHSCTSQGAELICSAVDAKGQKTFALSAAGASPAGGLTYKWTYEPPAVAGTDAAVQFSPDAISPNPVVSISTHGGAIAGEWRFHAAVTDLRGLTATAVQRVTVGNRPPVLTLSAPVEISVAHIFDGASSRFIAEGKTASYSIADLDGDTLQVAAAPQQTGTGPNATFVLDPAGDHWTFRLAVPYTGPADGAFLMGPDVARSVAVRVWDPNGGSATAAWKVTVTNRPPRVLTTVANVSAPHWFDKAASRYVATAAGSTFTDDDGDPLSLDAATGHSQCSGAGFLSGGTALVRCELAYTGTPAMLLFAGAHQVTTTVRDPWAYVAAFTAANITNRAPRLATTSYSVPTACSQEGTCCAWDTDVKPPECAGHHSVIHSGSAIVAPPVVDDDGDPISLGYRALGACASAYGSSLCAGGSCSLQLSTCGTAPTCTPSMPGGTVAVDASDGAASVSGSFTVAAVCR